MGTVNPDWQLFRTFLALSREGSLSGAARVLGMTQPTAGRQLAALEEALGVKLFTRSPDGLTPTDAGLRLIAPAQAMAAAAEQARRLSSGSVEPERGTVRITASEIIGSEVLPGILAAFQSRHPQIAIEVALSNRNDDVLRGDADIAVRMLRPEQGALLAKNVGGIEVGLFCHRDYLDSRSMPQRPEDLHRHVLIGYDRDLLYQKMIGWLGVPLGRDVFRFRSDSDTALLAALRAGIGIGACQLGIARRDPRLVPVLPQAILHSMDTWVLMHQDARANRIIRLMFDHLVAQLIAYANACRYGQ